MQTEKIINEITNYFENTILFQPNLTPHGLGSPIQLKKELKIDVTNNKSTDLDNNKIFELDSIEQGYKVIAGVYQKSIAEIQTMVDAFINEYKIEINKPLFLIAYLQEATSS